MKVKIAGIANDSIVDGEGYRYTIFSQGCPHHCPGCHNPKTWDFDGGKEVEVSELLEAIRSNPLLQGITLSGGEPFMQPEALYELSAEVKRQGLDVWAFSGWRFEELLSNPARAKLLSLVDVLVDGRFILEQRDLSLLFRGSKNQRLIDVQATIKTGEVVLWNPRQ